LGPYKAFERATEDREESSEVFRLKCGHAFHTACLCHSLRLDNGCPLCRGTASEVALDAEYDDQAEEVLTLEVANGVLSDVTRAIMTAGSRPDIQRVRARIHARIRTYRHMERHLCTRRAQIIRDALQQFRAQEYANFRRKCSRLKRDLRQLWRMEREATGVIIGSSAVDAIESIFGSGYALESWVPSGFGPLRPRFWGRVDDSQPEADS
jgi:hypothetical protein